jgi:UDP-N-acetylmuramate dehydrogenase
MNWWKDLKSKVKPNEPLKQHTTFKIGGRAKFFIEPKDTSDLKLILKLLKKYQISPFIIGAGSNILVSDKVIDGAVLCLNSPYFRKIRFKNNLLEAGSGMMLNKIVSLAQRCSLGGIEFLVGIPGTLGGALVMNAGVSGKSIADLVEKVMVMDYNGKIKTLDKSQLKFGYRSSNLAKYIILGAQLKLIKKNKKIIKQNLEKYLIYRLLTQDLSRPSAGCIFKNLKRYAAGKLIDLCGLKGKRIGDAGVSLKHANFILNLKAAKATDVIRLMQLIQKKVKARFNINLEPEIKIWQ